MRGAGGGAPWSVVKAVIDSCQQKQIEMVWEAKWKLD